MLYELRKLTGHTLDTTDRALIAALKTDARASITTLAAQIGVSRATVQTRLDRLTRGGTIRRFTIEAGAEADPDRIKAVMLIELEGPTKRSVVRALRRLPEITSLHSTNGAWDLVAQIETDSLPSFDRVLNAVRDIQGVQNSETCLLLDSAN
jgi:DNA-binding Lrp family transcriptional regulator